MSETEFLAIKEFDGKRVDVDASTTVSNTVTETDVVTQTASSGKDMYLSRAKGQMLISEATGVFDVTIKLVANGVTKGTRQYNDNAKDTEIDFDFNVIGVKVAATQIIKITVTHSSATATRNSITSSELILFEEDTGKTPQIPSI